MKSKAHKDTHINSGEFNKPYIPPEICHMKTTAYSPYTFTENFDSPELDGFAGPFVRYLYNTEDERVMEISPQGVTKYITDGRGQVLADYDDYNHKYNYIVLKTKLNMTLNI